MVTDSEKIIDSKVDWITIAVFLLLLVFGWISIYSSTYNGEQAKFYDLNYRYGMQLVWISVSLFLFFVIMLADIKYFHRYSYLVYCIAVFLMILALAIGKEVNGAKSWLGVGSFGVQPVEFMKLGVAFAIARIVSAYDFSTKSIVSVSIFSLVVIVPMLLSLLQNDTGSAMVFAVFSLVLYREGFPHEIFLLVLIVILLFVASFLVDRTMLYIFIFLFSILFFALVNRDFKNSMRTLAGLTLFSMALGTILNLLGIENVVFKSIVASGCFTLPLCFIYKKMDHKSKVWRILGLYIFMICFTFVIDFAYDNVLKPHQQVRILNLFGIQNDPRGTSYNVTQSKIAIGSGGLLGKGFMQGTQTRYSYVPEQETDFIFCTVGEEEGFAGTSLVVILFSILIFRLMLMGERADDVFVRGFCYSVAGVFLFHFVINISMTIGLFPVIGIPLPFFSYGGSSLIAFSAMLAVAIRLDSKRKLDNF